MLRVARQTDYAARIVLHLARLAGGMTTIARITQLDRLPDSFVRRLVGRMVKGGLLETVRGKKGGIRLARPAGQISLLDVVVAMEPPWNPQAARTPALAAWDAAFRILESSLASVRFDRLQAEPAAGGTGPSPHGRLLPTGS